MSAAAHTDEFKSSLEACLIWTETSATAMTLASFRTLAKTTQGSLVVSAPGT